MPRRDRATILHGDCLALLPTLRSNSIDACVTDPPYGLSFMGKDWDRCVPGVEYWRAVFRVMKPGAHLVALGGSRTYHRMACAIEDAGFEIRDCIQWLYGSGFPKSLDVSKAIDKRKDWSALPKLQSAILVARKRCGMSQTEAARAMGLIGPTETLGGGGFMWFETGMRAPTRKQWPRLKVALRMGDEFDLCFEQAEREVIGQRQCGDPRAWYAQADRNDGRVDVTAPATDAARQWSGFGTALKPACEPIVLARKPLSEGTVAANVLRWGTGALNIDGCRVGSDTRSRSRSRSLGEKVSGNLSMSGGNYAREFAGTVTGRWPANVIHDGSDVVVDAFPSAPGQQAAVRGSEPSNSARDIFNGLKGRHSPREPVGDSGSAARFFYAAKASRAERAGSKHPTVKPQKLMRYLVRLVTPPGGKVLDCFAGSGSTGEAALAEGFRVTLIERERKYVADIRRRIARAPKPRQAKPSQAKPSQAKPSQAKPSRVASSTAASRGTQHRSCRPELVTA